MPDTGMFPLDSQGRVDELAIIRARRVEALMTNPEEKERVMLDALLEVRDGVNEGKKEAIAARKYCKDTCQVDIDHRFKRLERFKAWLLGVGTTLVIIAGLLVTIWAVTREKGDSQSKNTSNGPTRVSAP